MMMDRPLLLLKGDDDMPIHPIDYLVHKEGGWHEKRYNKCMP